MATTIPRAKMALPIGHNPTTVSSVQLCLGKPFRQPLNLLSSNQYSQGLEVWINSSTDNNRLYAMFNGIITVKAATSTDPNTYLKLKVNAVEIKTLNKSTDLSEPVLNVIQYQNIDTEIVTNAFKDLLRTSYNNATGASSTWHPLLRTISNGLNFKHMLDNAKNQPTAGDTDANNLFKVFEIFYG